MIPADANWQSACPQNVNAAVSLVHVLSFPGLPGVGPFAFCSPGSRSPGSLPYISTMAGGGMESDGLQCTATNAALTVEILDYDQIFTSALAANTFEGQQAMLTSGFMGLGQADFIPCGTYIVDTVEPLEANLKYRLNLRDKGLLMEQTVWPYGNNGWPTSSANPLSVISDPMSILNAIMAACGYGSGDLNTPVISAYQQGLFYGCTMDFSITQPPQAKAWLSQEIYSPLAGFAFWNYAGKYTPHFLLPQGPPTVASYPVFTPRSIRDPIPVPGAGPYCAALMMMMDYDGQNYNTQNLSTDTAGLALYEGVVQITNRQSRGLRSANGGCMFAELAASATFRRYAVKPWILNYTSFWPSIVLEPGDVVPVTHPQIPIKGVGMGFVNRWFEVQKKEPNWVDGTVDLSLIDVNWMNATQRVIAPNGTPNYAGSSAAQRAEYLYPDQGQMVY